MRAANNAWMDDGAKTIETLCAAVGLMIHEPGGIGAAEWLLLGPVVTSSC
jgi:hypothetical protein